MGYIWVLVYVCLSDKNCPFSILDILYKKNLFVGASRINALGKTQYCSSGNPVFSLLLQVLLLLSLFAVFVELAFISTLTAKLSGHKKYITIRSDEGYGAGQIRCQLRLASTFLIFPKIYIN
jgi:hypothetical protein